jgi:pimeloyl-ACP methyl ester carboxylesterase
MPLMLAAPAPPDITCDLLKKFSQPTLVMRGEKTRVFYALVLVSEAISKCIPGAQLVVLQNAGHDGPSRDPAAFTGAVFEFLSRR